MAYKSNILVYAGLTSTACLQQSATLPIQTPSFISLSLPEVSSKYSVQATELNDIDEAIVWALERH